MLIPTNTPQLTGHNIPYLRPYLKQVAGYAVRQYKEILTQQFSIGKVLDRTYGMVLKVTYKVSVL